MVLQELNQEIAGSSLVEQLLKTLQEINSMKCHPFKMFNQNMLIIHPRKDKNTSIITLLWAEDMDIIAMENITICSWACRTLSVPYMSKRMNKVNQINVVSNG